MALERALGVELVKGMMRRSEPTEAGRVFYERIKPAVAAIIEARTEAASLRGEVLGPLKIGAPILFASSYVAPIVSRFLKLYPNVEVELRASDEQADLVAEGLDIAVRIGDSADDSLIARRLHALRVVVVGAPSYFAEHGPPKHPGDLEQHNCILRAGTDVIDKWPFRVDGRLQSVKVHGRFRSNSAASIRAAASEGAGPCPTTAMANQRSRFTGCARDRSAGIRNRGHADPARLAADTGAALRDAVVDASKTPES